MMCLILLIPAEAKSTVPTPFPTQKSSSVTAAPSSKESSSVTSFSTTKPVSTAPSYITEKVVAAREEGLEMKGVLPVATSKLRDLGKALNERIDEIYKQKICSAKETKARSIVFKYEYTQSRGVSSLLIYTTTTTASAKAEVDSFNFIEEDAKFVEVNDLLGSNGLRLADKIISAQVRADPERFYADFPGLKQEDAFCIIDDEIVFMFDAFQIAPGSEGIIRFPLVIDNVINAKVVLGNGFWIKDETYSLKMISLRFICDNLNFDLGWDAADKAITLSREGEISVDLKPGTNVYKTNYPNAPGKVSKRSLESAPEIVDGITYVPISFFDQILESVAYSVGENDSIVFSTYIPVVKE
jgi:hypothetical protein